MPTSSASRKSSGRVALAARCEIRAAANPADATSPRLFRMVANTGEPMHIAGFEYPVVVDLATIDTTGLPVPALYDHCPEVDYIVGQVTSGSIAGAEFIANGVFTPPADDTPPEKNYCRKVLSRADSGYVWQTSVGGDPKKVDTVPAGQTAQVNGRQYAGPVCVARGLVLREISFVVLGGDRRTSAVVTRLKGTRMKFEDFVRSLEVDPEKMTEAQAANFKRIHGDLYPADPKKDDVSADDATEPADPNKVDDVSADDATPPADDPNKVDDAAPTNAGAKGAQLKAARVNAKAVVDELRAEAAKERKRIEKINAHATEYGNPKFKIDGAAVEIAAHAIEKGWTTQKAELEMLRVHRGSGPAAIIKGHDKDCTKQSLQAAMILRAGGKLDHKAYKTMGAQALLGKVAPWLLRDINDADRNRFMEAGHRYGSMSMVDLCRESLRLDGRDIPHERDEMIRAAFSGGGNLSNIFTTNVNAILLATYVEFGADTTMGWVTEQDVNDFKTNERPRVNVGDGLKKLPRGGEAEHASYTDSVESYKIARYAKQFEIDEQDAIDDNFSVFSDTPKSMGQAAARLRPDLVYGAVVLANPTLNGTSLALFSDSNSPDNLLGSSALAYATLSTGLAKMRLVRENSVNLNLEATHLVVPPTLEDLAIELTSSINIIAGGDTGVSVRGNANSLSRRGLSVVAEPRLENGVVNPADETSQSGSASSWYLVCANAHTIEVGYLKGTGRAPRVRATMLDKGRWGMNWDVSMDIGVKALDFKGMSKSTQ